MKDITLQTIIRDIISTEDFSLPEPPAAFDENRYRYFLQVISNQPQVPPRDPAASKIRQWLAQKSLEGQFDGHFEAPSSCLAAWKQSLQPYWNRAQKAFSKQSAEALFQPLYEVIEQLNHIMQPAPAFRGSGAAQYIPKPLRRAIEAADLPTFPPLFCNAYDFTEHPIRFHGLTPQQNHRLTLRCLQNAERQKTLCAASSPRGELTFHLSEETATLLNSPGQPLELVWLLEAVPEKQDPPHQPPRWSSGFIWINQETGGESIEAFRSILLQPSAETLSEQAMQQLIEINLLTRWERYTEAYELARKCLLASASGTDEQTILYREALWQFVHRLIQTMTLRMEQAAPAVQSLQPEWNAVGSLRELAFSIQEWN